MGGFTLPAACDTLAPMLKRYRVTTPFQHVIVLATSAVAARRLCLHWTGKVVTVTVECLDGQRHITAGKQEDTLA